MTQNGGKFEFWTVCAFNLHKVSVNIKILRRVAEIKKIFLLKKKKNKYFENTILGEMCVI